MPASASTGGWFSARHGLWLSRRFLFELGTRIQREDRSGWSVGSASLGTRVGRMHPVLCCNAMDETEGSGLG